MTTQTTSLPNGTWTLDTAATTLNVTVKKMKVMTVPAKLTVTSGAVTITDGVVTSVEVIADAGSYASPNAKRNEHVTGPDFLDASSHPTITFSASGGSSSQVAGEVAIKGQTTPVTFVVSDVQVDGESASFTATTVIDRFKLGIDKMPSFVIAKDLDIEVKASVARQQ